MFNGQAEQDKFVVNVLNNKKNGYFLEIGANHPIKINNSYLLETKYNWKGIMVECENEFLPLYKQHRPNSNLRERTFNTNCIHNEPTPRNPRFADPFRFVRKKLSNFDGLYS